MLRGEFFNLIGQNSLAKEGITDGEGINVKLWYLYNCLSDSAVKIKVNRSMLVPLINSRDEAQIK